MTFGTTKKHSTEEVMGKAAMVKSVENAGPGERRTTQSLDWA